MALYNDFDIILFIVFMVYILLVIVIASRLKEDGKISGFVSRKFVHINVGLLVIFIPLLFSSRFIPVLLAGTFIFGNYLTSPLSPIEKLKFSALQEGHNLGTVYYSISLTTLLFLFFDDPWIIQAGFMPLVIGDAVAGLAGIKYGMHKWSINPLKSKEGSFAAFISTGIILYIVLAFYKLLGLFNYSNSSLITITITISLITMIVELVSPKGLDNLTIPLFSTITAYLFSSFVF